MKRRTLGMVLAVLAVLILTGAGYWQQSRLRNTSAALVVRGQTMGTTYSIRTGGNARLTANELQAKVEERLLALNASLSTWDPSSEISRFNAAPAGEVTALSDDLRIVTEAALSLARATHGAFDPTVGPLVNLWGFGPESGRDRPTDSRIAEVRARIGYELVQLDGASARKQRSGVVLDLSANAKGYGVDAIARVLEAEGISDYVVEIGGDLRVRGHNSRGLPWAIGIDRPVLGAPQGASLAGSVHLVQGALATSGSYRRFRREDGQLRHHIIDPRTGYPTASQLVAVTVYAPDCMTADGIATALMVLGVEEGLAWVARRPDIEALFIEADGDHLVRHLSANFPAIRPPP